ncbi:hypothetical protein D9M73_120520 [compost metagenome]
MAEGSSTISRIATPRPGMLGEGTWILRLPRMAPVVTPISVRAGMSAMVSLQRLGMERKRKPTVDTAPSLRPC